MSDMRVMRFCYLCSLRGVSERRRGVIVLMARMQAFQFAWDILPSLASFALMCKTEEMGVCAANW